MLVNADEFSFLFGVGDHVVDGDLGGSTGSSRNGDRGNRVILCRRNAFQRAHVGKFEIGDDNADRFGSVHGGTAADGDDGISAASLECSHAVLYVLNGRIGLDPGINGVGDLRFIKQIRHFSGYAEFDQIGVGANKNMLKAFCLSDHRDLADSAFAVM